MQEESDEDSMDAFQTASIMPAKKVLMLGGGAKKTNSGATNSEKKNKI